MLPVCTRGADIRNLILQETDPWEGEEQPIFYKQGIADLHQIIEGIYLGNDKRFFEVLHRDNPHQFESVISVCGFTRMARAFPELATLPREAVEANLKERNIQWLQLGDAVPDDPQAWTDIVFNATFPTHALARADGEIPHNSMDSNHVALRAKKKAEVLRLSPHKWFEPAFEKLREGVAGKKTLLHCHAGVSRSPLVLAAFLIREYGVSDDAAINFLRSKRYCVNPKCRKDLKDYAIALRK